MSGEPFQIPGLGRLSDANPAIAPDMAVAAQHSEADQKNLAELEARDAMHETPATQTAPTDHNNDTAIGPQNQATVENPSGADNNDAMEIESEINPSSAVTTNPGAEVIAAGAPNGEHSSESTTRDAMEIETEATSKTENGTEVDVKDSMETKSEDTKEINAEDNMEIKSWVNPSDSGETSQVMDVVSTESKVEGPTNGDIISTLDAALALEDVSQEAGVMAEDENPEWEADSSPYESSSEDSSDDSSDDDSDDGDHPMLGIEETVRILMAGDDNDGDAAKSGRGPVPIRTKNERDEEPLPKPDVTITPEMKIELIGHVVSVIDTTLVIESLKDGETRVLNIGSVLCKEDRTVVGALADTFGPVKEPRYLVFFDRPEEIKDFGLEKGTPIYYSVAHADYVFTQALKQERGTDASNLHDEEVAPEDMEFSDDEKEAAYRKSLKNKKRGGKAGRGREKNSTAERDQSELKYDEDEDGPYKPLTRPETFAQGVLSSLPPRPPVGYPAPPLTGRHSSHRGRGPRGGYRGGRGGRGGHGGRDGHAGSGNYENAQGAPPPFPVVQPPPFGHGFVPPPPPGWTGQPSFPAPPAPFSRPQGHQHQVPSGPFNFGYQGWNQGQQGWGAQAPGSTLPTPYGNPAYSQGNSHNQQTPGQGQGHPPAYWPNAQPPP